MALFIPFLLLSLAECLIAVARKYKRFASIRGKLFDYKARNTKRF